MSVIQLHDRNFEVFIERKVLANRIKELADVINSDLKGQLPVFVVVLNGAFIFAADLLRNINLNHEIAFIRVSSYEGIQSNGSVQQLMGFTQDLSSRHVVIVEDVVETGKTLSFLIDQINRQDPASVKVASLLIKSSFGSTGQHVDYAGFDAGERFVVGYGMDYDGLGRSLPDLYVEVAHQI